MALWLPEGSGRLRDAAGGDGALGGPQQELFWGGEGGSRWKWAEEKVGSEESKTVCRQLWEGVGCEGGRRIRA